MTNLLTWLCLVLLPMSVYKQWGLWPAVAAVTAAFLLMPYRYHNRG